MGTTFATGLFFACITMCNAQGNHGAESRDIDSAIETIRADFRADKTQLITQAMAFSSGDAKIFWPVYRKYDAELTVINDQRVELIKQYANKYASITESDAKSILDQALDFEKKRAELKQKYAREFERGGLSAVTTAKFFQLEHRLDALVDLQLASELPALIVRRNVK
jgi:hypothetical protein